MFRARLAEQSEHALYCLRDGRIHGWQLVALE
jgi:hypothetical protein